MESRKTVSGSHRALLLGVLVASVLAIHPRALFAATDACALLKAADVASLVGAAPQQKPSPEKGACDWTGATPKHRLVVLTYKNQGVPPEAAFMGARQGAQHSADSKLSDEPGIGTKAFSFQAAFGAGFVVLKSGRMIQLQYWTGAHGTSQDVALLRPVVKKAIAAF